MTGTFVVRTTPHYERLARDLARTHTEFLARQKEAVQILGADPHNRSREHNILKLGGVRQGEGQYRIRLRRFRFRYDIYDRNVVLQACSLRREDTYR
jgi:mRNA-degrading endonuclease RelE of RelBE toxin-antitoxin system